MWTLNVEYKRKERWVWEMMRKGENLNTFDQFQSHRQLTAINI